MASTDSLFGIGNTTSTSNDGTGALITTSELKSSFAGKTPFSGSVAPIDMMYLYNNGSDGNYVCFVPKAKANRTLYGQLRCVNGDGTMTSPGEDSCTAMVADDTSWTQTTTYLSATQAHFLCVPEGATVAGVTPASTTP